MLSVSCHNRIKRVKQLLIMLALTASSSQARAKDMTVAFEPGASNPPAGWTIAGTNQRGPLAAWTFDQQALVTPAHGSDATFNLAWTNGVSFRDGTIEVQVKSVAGRVDQGGGLIWRLQDADHYYLARINPLEDNFRIYVVKKGVRTVLASERLTLEKDVWQTLKVVHAGGRIEGFLDGKKHLDLKDDSISLPGRVGLWTKADAVTAFDDLRIGPTN